MTALRGYAYAKMGQTNEVYGVLEEVLNIQRTGAYLQPYFVTRVYAALGQNARALDWLEKAEVDRSEYLFFADFAGLRADVAWDGLQRRTTLLGTPRTPGPGQEPVAKAETGTNAVTPPQTTDGAL